MKKHLRKRPKSSLQMKSADMADRGKNISKFFSKSGTMKSPIQRENVDFNESMLEELDTIANELNISRQQSLRLIFVRHLINTI